MSSVGGTVREWDLSYRGQKPIIVPNQTGSVGLSIERAGSPPAVVRFQVTPETLTLARETPTGEIQLVGDDGFGLTYAQFAAQRRLNFTYDYGNCREASTTSWTSRNCAFNPSQTSNSLYNSALVVNGSPCTTIETAPDGPPYVVDCPQFAARLGGVVIFNGEEDMFIRHDYANALCDWFNRTGTAPCSVNTYPNAGHGVPFNYGSSIFNGINGALPRIR